MTKHRERRLSAARRDRRKTATGVDVAEEAVFGHYRLLTLFGRGGMGEVWHAHDTRKDRDIALKILGSWLGAEPDYARRFRREAALAARLTRRTSSPSTTTARSTASSSSTCR